ncbi:MAG: hypothetical protein GC179_26145 [Anaerolineaceae bacterium]|nr:hypothetical protein [Anaerolineaceae bacterium]
MIEADPVFGKVIANYPSNRTRLILPAVVLSGVASVILNVTLAEVEAWWGPVLTVVIMAAVVLGLGWRVLHFWNHEVVLYEEGFSFREGARPIFFLYHEIMSIRQQGQRLAYFGGLIRRNTYRFTLTTLRGEVMKLDNTYVRIEEMGAQIEKKIYAVLEPYLKEEMAKGEKIPFSDSLRLSTEGLEERGRELPWEEFDGYKISDGQIAIFAQPERSTWLTIPLPDVDNLPILVRWLKQREFTPPSMITVEPKR